MNPHSLPTARKHRLWPTFTANGTNSGLIIGLVMIAIGYLLLVGQTPVQARCHRTGKTTVFRTIGPTLPTYLKPRFSVWITGCGNQRPTFPIAVGFVKPCGLGVSTLYS